MISWSCQPFAQLNLQSLYEIMQLRQSVFVVEQDCPYLDADGIDQQSLHVSGHQDGQLVTYLRLVAPGVKYAEPSLGRVITSQRVRGTGAGHVLLQVGLREHKRLYPGCDNRISAQAHLQGFYETAGFVRISEQPYLEDNIPHIEMLWRQQESGLRIQGSVV